MLDIVDRDQTQNHSRISGTETYMAAVIDRYGLVIPRCRNRFHRNIMPMIGGVSNKH
jgi:hypothetical protein